MREGKLHQRIKEKHFTKQVEDELISTLEEFKATRPKYEYTSDNPPPKDPLIAVNDLMKRRERHFKEFFGEL